MRIKLAPKLCLLADGAGFYGAGAGVAGGDGAGFADVAFGEGKGSGCRAIGKELFALPEYDGVGYEAQFVYQIVRQQQLHQLTTAPGVKVGAIRFFELLYVFQIP